MTHGLHGEDARILQRLHDFYVCDDRVFDLYRISSVQGRLLASWKCSLSDSSRQDMAVVRACPTPRILLRILLHGRPRCNLDIGIGTLPTCQTNPLVRGILGFINRADGRLGIYMTAAVPSRLSLALPTTPPSFSTPTVTTTPVPSRPILCYHSISIF